MLNSNPAKAFLQAEFDAHRSDAELGYRMVEHDCEQARLSRVQYPDQPVKWVGTFVFDHQKKFDVPHLVTKQARFNHQLSVFTFGVYSAHTDRHFFHLWSEWDGACGSDETITCLLAVIADQSGSLGQGILNLICDSCGGQNKNQFLLAFAAELSRPGSAFYRFAEVNIKFPEVDHTFLPNDRIFGVISQHVKKHNFYDPRELLPLIQQSFDPRHPQHAVWMNRLDFKNYGAYMVSTYKILGAAALGGDPHDGGAEKLLLRDDAKWMNFGRHRQWSHPGEMWVRSCLQASATWKKYRACVSLPSTEPDRCRRCDKMPMKVENSKSRSRRLCLDCMEFVDGRSRCSP
ncbi:MULE transposase domain-containing protein [Plasmodiophora brassicae]